MEFVTYRAFGARGDGFTNDLPAIRAAHEYANAHGLPVRADAGDVYYIAAGAAAVIRTDTDWRGARFTVDDRFLRLEERGVPVFLVKADQPTARIDPPAPPKKCAGKLELTLPQKSVVVLHEEGTKRYIRKGLNANSGSDQVDIVVVDEAGNVDPRSPIIWDYKNVTSAEVIPMDPVTLHIRGGVFTTIAKHCVWEPGYHKRGLEIVRSNVEIDGLEHYVTGEGERGSPYSGILHIHDCADVTVKNCVFTPHRTFWYWRKSDGVYRSQGTYDTSPARVVNLTYENCTQTVDIFDTAYWGVMGSNFCKNITLRGCTFSRFDAHQGVANVTVLGCTLGWQCLNAIGMGTIRVEDSTLFGRSLINLRADYGSTWEGDAVIRNCRWIPNSGLPLSRICAVIGGTNTEDHDFGYDCFMPHTVTVDGLHIDDANRGTDGGICILGNLNPNRTADASDFPYPIAPTERVVIRNLTTASGIIPRRTANDAMYPETVFEGI